MANHRNCPDCGGECDAILDALKEALGIPVQLQLAIPAPSSASMPEISAYESSMSRRLGVSVEQLRREQAEADRFMSDPNEGDN